MTGGEERKVQLYVYDLSRGLARAYSQALLGRQIDAVYHTSVVIDGVEIYYGAGLQRSYPGATHHGQPQEVVQLGTTSLPADVIAEYLDSMKEIYAPEAYDLFMHNCNNFTNDFAMFLVGKGIPNHITSLPADVLATPFGQMLRPQLDAAMRPITTAPSVSEPGPSSTLSPPPFSTLNSTSISTTTTIPTSSKQSIYTGVHTAINLQDFNRLLNPSTKAAVIFFTSANCHPCKVVYPHFEELAEKSAGKATFIKVDTSQSFDIASKYQIRATPTFISFVKGEKLDEWLGGHPGTLKANVEMMLQIAYPPHPHESLRVPILAGTATSSFVTFSKVPPIEKLLAKLGDGISTQPPIQQMKTFITTRQTQGSIEAKVPDLPVLSKFLQTSFRDLPPTMLFPLTDLFRLTLIDPRVSGWYAEEPGHATIKSLLQTATSTDIVPYSLRLVSVQAACNLFTTPLFLPHLVSQPLINLLILIITSSLLDATHPPLRVAAASLAFNLVAYNHSQRIASSDVISERQDVISEDEMIQLLASIVEAVERETESKDALRGLLLSLGLVLYGCKVDGEVMDLARVLDSGKMVGEKGRKAGKEVLGEDGKALCREIGELLGSGARKP